jgi:signal transduction histidine kinase
MSLLARTRLVVVLVAILTLLLSGAFYVAHQRQVAAQVAMAQLFDIWTAVAQLRTATFDFAQQGNERVRTQTEAAIRRLHVLVSDDWLAAPVGEHVAENQRLRREIHHTLIEVEAQLARSTTAAPSLSLEESERRTRALLNLKGLFLETNIASLSVILRDEVAQSQARADEVALALGGLLLAMALAAIALLERQILRPLDQLRQAAAEIGMGKGEFAANLVLARNDEIGQLSRVLAAMVTKLEVANKELESFSYSVSHDLRAPLRAIDGFSRKVVAGYGDKLDDEGCRQLQVVRDNAQRMGQLIDDLLAFSRMGRHEIALQRLDMDRLARNVATELRAAEAERAIEFVFVPLPPAQGDAAMLRQVWANLLGNAVKFSRRRQDARIEVGGRVEAGEALYWVKDNGAGFDMQYAVKLFGVFQRLHRQDEFEGTGVGLAIAQRILHRHNGRIWGEGKPDVGATFWFTLPLPASGKPLSGGQAP